MTPFRYRAARADGGIVEGLVDAGSASQASATVTDRGLFPLTVTPVGEQVVGLRVQVARTLVDVGPAPRIERDSLLQVGAAPVARLGIPRRLCP